MASVWVVEWCSSAYENGVSAVFSTKEKAEAWVALKEELQNKLPRLTKLDYDIEEYEVDEVASET